MAVGWIQIDKDLEEKPEFLELLAVDSEPVETVGWRLIRFWGWVDDYVPKGGRIEKLTSTGLRLKFGGSAAWWECMKRVNWLGEDANGLFIPGHDQRFTNSAKQRLQHSKRANLAREKNKSDKPPRAPRAQRQRTESAPDAQQKRHLDIDKDITINKELEGNSSGPSDSLRASTSNVLQGGTAADADALKNSGPTKADEGTPSASPPLAAKTTGKPAAKPPATDWVREINWHAVPLIGKRLVTKLELDRVTDLDYELLAKVAALAQGRLSEHIVWDSVEAVRQQYLIASEAPKVPKCGYWHRTLISMCDQIGENFNQLLAMIKIPPEHAKRKKPETVHAPP